ncbi:hypothetical protein [Cognatilysobacter segetis]|uniref:hypothetical protein n=1 Tax=Cognatilysobacter segetis TaxID=2492394 RepID=UPI00105CEAB1|nr:hypothetical protein [Lysobacter segetis]
MRPRLPVLAAVLALGAAFPSASTPRAASAESLEVPVAERRGGDQTYLTYPEWFLVFSPAEYANMLQQGQSPARFPFFAHVGQFWQAYGRVVDAVRGRWAFNGEYHTMIAVIGASTTVEYGLKGAYETLVGRLAETGTPPLSTPEERLAAKQARDYVDFIHVRPWYEFDFVTPLKALWRDTPWTGPHLVRKWERRYLLTSEWLAKAGYAALITRATRSTFEVARPTTAVIVDRLPVDGAVPVRAREGDRALAVLPRYQPFTAEAQRIARAGGGFVDIAGNRGDVLVTAVVPGTTPRPPGTRILLRQPILTRPGYERRLLATPVAGLAPLLRAEPGVEHVFDY